MTPPPPSPEDRLEKRVDEFRLAAAHVVVGKISFHHSDAAIYVIADRSGRDTAGSGVDRADAADREPVP